MRQLTSQRRDFLSPALSQQRGGANANEIAATCQTKQMQLIQRLNSKNEAIWLLVGSVAEKQGNLEQAATAYNKALCFNPVNVPALIALASISRKRENYSKAIEYLQMVLSLDSKNGEMWGALGHCNLMTEELRRAYDAYQEALLHLPNPRDPSLWYGIGLLYDKYGCLEQAEGAFAGVLKMDDHFEKKDDIYYQLALIYKQQGRYSPALDCFKYILKKPPPPLTTSDIWFEIGHTYEILKDFEKSLEAYRKVQATHPEVPKILHRLGWLLNVYGTDGQKDEGYNLLLQAIQLDHNDSEAWYLIGRTYMAGGKFRRAYDAFQQAIYRDPNNPVSWCSIGVLYYLMQQHRDALHAYIRAIRLNPNLAEGWYDLGALYEVCDQPQDAQDAYNKVSELESGTDVAERLAKVKEMIEKAAQSKEGDKESSDEKDTRPVLQPFLPDPANPNSNPNAPTQIPDLVLPEGQPAHTSGSVSNSAFLKTALPIARPAGSTFPPRAPGQ